MKGNFHNSVPIASPVTRSVSYQFVFQQPLFEFLDCSNQYRTDVSTDSPEDLKYWMWDERVLRGTSQFQQMVPVRILWMAAWI
ncbi:hypothetical protein Y032_0123g1161 [Ancylostoma ceylanicum]|uniref:Uncharacterized protein n=1 Tax=Ancylostoma ceylanicum TaxID=53326 RepID=A0A016T9M3_9BILA|nr:hypothetical protein Y032_0123g1161 [Ancylostoma ceylanicum]